MNYDFISFSNCISGFQQSLQNGVEDEMYPIFFRGFGENARLYLQAAV